MDEHQQEAENLREMVRGGGWEVLSSRMVVEAASLMNQMTAPEAGADEMRMLAARIRTIDWMRKLPMVLIAEYDVQVAQAKEDNPPDANPPDRACPIPEEGTV